MSDSFSVRAARVRLLLVALLSAVTLSGCVVYYSAPPTLAQQQLINRFTTERGEGAVYRVGETLRFRLHSERAGYLSLWATDPDGSRYELAHNLTVQRGSNLISGPTAATRFRLVPPGGEHRVQAFFREQPFPARFSQGRDVASLAQDSVETRFLVLGR